MSKSSLKCLAAAAAVHALISAWKPSAELFSAKVQIDNCETLQQQQTQQKEDKCGETRLSSDAQQVTVTTTTVSIKLSTIKKKKTLTCQHCQQ